MSNLIINIIPVALLVMSGLSLLTIIVLSVVDHVRGTADNTVANAVERWHAEKPY